MYNVGGYFYNIIAIIFIKTNDQLGSVIKLIIIHILRADK